MTAAWMWARADLRARWRSWVVLGLLAGVTFGLAAAGVAGARRAHEELPRYLAAAGRVDAAVLANDPGFDAAKRAELAKLPEVARADPFLVGFALATTNVGGGGGYLLPTTPAGARFMSGVILEGRQADPRRADEVVIDENARDRYGLHLGSRVVVAQEVSADPTDLSQFPEGTVPAYNDPSDLAIHAPLRVVGIAKAVGSDINIVPGSGFYQKYRDRLIGVVNDFVVLRNGEAAFSRFQQDVQQIVGHPVNVERGSDLFGYRQTHSLTNIERDGLLLFALAVIVGGSVLVGQALVRAVTAGTGDLPSLRAMGADRTLLVRAMVMPAIVVAVVGALCSVVVAIALSPRFPIGAARAYDLDLGIHADWLVLGLAAFALFVGVVGAAVVTAWWRSSTRDASVGRPSSAGSWAARAGFPPALVVGSRLAVEPGRGRRAVPVRSALVGAIVGVLGVVACFTFRSGVSDAVASPQRSGILWDYGVVVDGALAPDVVKAVVHDPAVQGAFDAQWSRAVQINGVSTPTFGTTPERGNLSFLVLSGRAPRGDDEIAFAPQTMNDLGLHLGDTVSVEGLPSPVRVVGKALVTETSHTAYDQSAWMSAAALRRALDAQPPDSSDVQDYLLVKWKPGADVPAAMKRLGKLKPEGGFVGRATLPSAVIELGRLRVLPLSLAIFFALLAIATVAHALVTTVRRRRHDLAIMRSFGFTARQSRVAIAWQATLLAAAGVVVGVPLGIIVGRAIWRGLANSYPVVYVPPLALAVVLLVIPLAVLVVNAIAVAPGRAAARIRPAEALRVE